MKLRNLITALVVLTATVKISPADELIFVFNPNRSEELFKQDIISVVQVMQNAESGDIITCLDTRGELIVHGKVPDGSRFRTDREVRGMLSKLKQYAMGVLRQPNTVEFHDVPLMINHISDRARLAQGTPYIVLFDSGVHRNSSFSFKDGWPSDGFISNQLSPFFHIGNLPGRVIMVLDKNDFTSFDKVTHQNKLMIFYAKLFSTKGGALIAYTHAHDQIGTFINQGISHPVHNDLALDNSDDLTLYSIGGEQPNLNSCPTRIELEWDAPVDLDLHTVLVDASGQPIKMSFRNQVTSQGEWWKRERHEVCNFAPEGEVELREVWVHYFQGASTLVNATVKIHRGDTFQEFPLTFNNIVGATNAPKNAPQWRPVRF